MIYRDGFMCPVERVRVRLSCRMRLRVRPNEDRERRLMKICAVLESFMGASRVCLSRRKALLGRLRIRPGKPRIRQLRTPLAKPEFRRTDQGLSNDLSLRVLSNGLSLRVLSNDRSLRALLNDGSRVVMNRAGALCDRLCLKVTNAKEANKVSRIARGVSQKGRRLKTDQSHGLNPATNHRARSHELNPVQNQRAPIHLLG